jgi:tetratricopeptide (TPR) repeat protein
MALREGLGLAPRHPARRRRPRSAALASGAAAALLLLQGCASGGAYDYTPAGMRREIARRLPRADAASIAVPFEIDEATAERATQILRGVAPGTEPLDALVASLSDPAGFGLHYEWATTGTASETLAHGGGNCLSLSSTLVGIARAVGFQARYLEVIVAEPRWRTDGDLAVQADHVAAIVDSGSRRLAVDFSGQLGRARSMRIIDDFEALAHYYNNRGYELLHRAESAGGAIPWQEAARNFELATRIDPRHVRAWNNLGVARARLGDDAGARRAYETALGIEAGNQSAHLNLVVLYLRAGDLAKAAEHLEAARQLDPRNPQIPRLTKSLAQGAGAGGPGS